MTPTPDFLEPVIVPAVTRAARIVGPGVVRIDGASLRHRELLMEAVTSGVTESVAEALLGTGIDSPSFISACQVAALAAFDAEVQRMRSGARP